MSPRRALAAVSLAVFLLALLAGAYRVYLLEQRELEHTTSARTLRELSRRPGATRISARLASLELRGGERAVFELCSPEGLSVERFRDALDFAVLDLDGGELLLRVPMDSAHLAHVRTSPRGGCLMLGQGLLEHDSTYSIDAVWPKTPPSAAVLDTPLVARVLAKAELGALDHAALLGLAIAVLLGLLALSSPAPEPEGAVLDEASEAAAHPSHAGLEVGLAVAALFGATLVPLYGATLTLAKGAMLLALQTALALGLARRLRARDVRSALGLFAPERRLISLVSAVVAWPLLVAAAKLSLQWVPATGESPIETFVSWPSGMLSAALLGVFLPIGEEVFFRGYIYAALLRFGRTSAFGVSLLAFVLLHAAQAWGQWGALLAIACAGAVFTGLRMSSGSTLVPALTHVAYNFALSASSIFRE